MNTTYVHKPSVHNLDAPSQIVPFLMELFQPKSVADIGCGTGTFLKVFQDNGVQNLWGVDGAWVKPEILMIDQKYFTTLDLNEPIVVEKRFDLALCLEVAEHLLESTADHLVRSLVELGDVIVFSAAVVNQGGQNHINEQNFSYWQQKFAKHGFGFYDGLRKKFWDCKEVNWWYKQNMFIVAPIDRKDAYSQKGLQLLTDADVFIHPELLALKNDQIEKLTQKLHQYDAGKAPIRSYVRLLLAKAKNLLGVQ